MKFFIDSTSFFPREEEDGTLSLINLTTNAVQYLNRGARRILDVCDKWVDLDAFVDSRHFANVPREKVYNDYLKLLYEMDAVDLVQLKDRPENSKSGVFQAQAEDYANLSAFICANVNSANTCAITNNPLYYSKNGMYSRLKFGSSLYIVYAASGKITGVLEFSTRQLIFSQAAITLQSVIMDASLSEAECEAEIKAMLDEAARVCSAAYRKIRYAYINLRQEKTCRVLQNNGFIKSTELEKELRNGQTLVCYDRIIAS